MTDMNAELEQLQRESFAYFIHEANPDNGNFTNKGEVDHEFVMDTEENVQEHKLVMEKNPDMEHADDNSLRLVPGAKGQIIWTFAKDGKYSFACLIPGHYEAGMHGKLQVNK